MTHSPALTLARDALKLVLQFCDDKKHGELPKGLNQGSVVIFSEQALAAIDAELAASADAGRQQAIDALQSRLSARAYGQHAGFLSAAETVDIVLAALSRPAPATMATEAVSAQGDERAALREALRPFLTALEVNDGDTLSGMDSDKKVLFTMTGSWSHDAPVTLGDLRKLAKAARAQVAQGDEVDAAEPLLHTDDADELPESHPLAYECVDCDACGSMVHAANNECMRVWVEMKGRGNFCLNCYAKAGGHPWPVDAARAQQGGQR